MCALFAGRIKRTYCAYLELTKATRTADATIRAFCALLEALPEVERRLWNDATVRDFNIGVQGGEEPRCTEFVLAARTVQAVSALNARIVFSVYAPDEFLTSRLSE